MVVNCVRYWSVDHPWSTTRSSYTRWEVTAHMHHAACPTSHAGSGSPSSWSRLMTSSQRCSRTCSRSFRVRVRGRVGATKDVERGGDTSELGLEPGLERDGLAQGVARSGPRRPGVGVQGCAPPRPPSARPRRTGLPDLRSAGRALAGRRRRAWRPASWIRRRPGFAPAARAPPVPLQNAVMASDLGLIESFTRPGGTR
jgi:hypothetical protein